MSKAFLAGASKVFEAMFSSGMREAKENVVKIEDLQPDQVDLLLRYIYSGHLDDFDQHADRLIEAAEKYQMTDLKVSAGFETLAHSIQL